MMNTSQPFEMVVGLEIHIQLNTHSKLFSSDSTLFGAAPNSQTNAVSLAHPGTMPVLNKAAITSAIKMGLACSSEISSKVYFDRKHYFYPDSPLGYQITQQNNPVCKGGAINLPYTGGEKKIELEKIHLEADAGKSIHDQSEEFSLIDLNRAGMPLLELVTKPVLYSVEDVGQFIAEIQRIVRYLGISDGNMEEGSLRCDANISIKKRSEENLGQKVEIKNMNSIRHIKKALLYEFERQAILLKKGEKVTSESRLFDIAKGITVGMREKEEAHDYRYFPDPDITPYIISEEELIEVRNTLIVLPQQLRRSFTLDYGLTDYDTLILTESSLYANSLIGLIDLGVKPKVGAKWLIGPIKGEINQVGESELKLNLKELANLITEVESKKITYKNAIDLVLPKIIRDDKLKISDIIKQMNLVVEADESLLGEVINEVLNKHPREVEAYKKGKKAVLQLFMGEVMKKTKGKADPKITLKLFKDKLG